MSDPAMKVDRVLELAEAVYSKDASENDFIELNSLLHTERESRSRFLDYCWIHASLRLQLRASRVAQKVHQQIDSKLPLPVSVDSNAEGVEPSTATPFGFLPTTLHGTLGYFSSGWPVAYLVATVIMGIGALIAGFTYVSQPEQVAMHTSPNMGGQVPSEPQIDVVGRITGMVDCQWADPQTAPSNNAVGLGRKYALASGLMEITYDTGAKVVLQGPVTYEVESAAGGYLSLGKLTARVEKKAESTENQNSVIRNLKFFAIRTPTATVTDLGTEFGVEVTGKGDSRVHVFQGKVELQWDGGADAKSRHTLRLIEAESVEVGRGKNGGSRAHRISTQQADFVRGMPERTAIRVFSTGKDLKQGQTDPHWQIVAVSRNQNVNRCLPITVTGWNADTIIHAGAASPTGGASSDVNGDSPGAWAWYEKGSYYGLLNRDIGLPSNRTIISACNPDVTFQFQSYSGANTVVAKTGSNATLTLVTPAMYSKLAILSTGGYAGSTWHAVMNFSDGTSTTLDAVSSDSFNGSAAANTALSGVGYAHLTPNWESTTTGTNGRLYEHDFKLSTGDSNKRLTSITFVSSGVTDIYAVSGDPNFKPGPAEIVESCPDWRENDPDRSQWISLRGAECPVGVVYTFHTTFDLTGFLPSTVSLRVWFSVDNTVTAIRINGRSVRVPPHTDRSSCQLVHPFVVASGFTEGTNTLEIDAGNRDNGPPGTPHPFGLHVELEGYGMEKTTNKNAEK